MYRFKIKNPLNITVSLEDLVNGVLESVCYYYNTISKSTVKSMRKIEGKSFSEIFNTEEIKNLIKDFIKNDFKTSGFIILNINKKKKYFFISFEGIVKKNKLLEIWGTRIEVTKNETLEQKESEEDLFRNLFQSNPEAVVYLDKHSRVININPRFTELFGYSLEEIKGKNINEGIIHPEGLKEEGKNLTKLLLKRATLISKQSERKKMEQHSLY